MKKGTFDRLSPEQQSEIATLAALDETKIDTGDIPEQRDWTGARRGLFFRPIKRQITLRLDADVIEWFKSRAEPKRGYQTQMNQALREYVAKHIEEEPERPR